jgi:hypothetical protein
MAGIDNFSRKPYNDLTSVKSSQTGIAAKPSLMSQVGSLHMNIGRHACHLAITALAFVAPLGSVSAQEATPLAASAKLAMELNALQPTANGCRFTFMVKNDLGGELSSAAFELVLFDKAGMVSRMTIVDFKDLPNGKTKVRQFDFSGVDCAQLGRVLINDATDCKGEGIDPRACIRALAPESRTAVTFGT